MGRGIVWIGVGANHSCVVIDDDFKDVDYTDNYLRQMSLDTIIDTQIDRHNT